MIDSRHSSIFTQESKILLKGGLILDLVSGKEGRADIAIADGKIAKIGNIDPADFQGKEVDVSGNYIVQGLMDMHVHLREPGREDEETIESGCAAAMAGGFTAVASMPNTDPPCDNQEVVRFIKRKSEVELVEVFPIAAITKGRIGGEITEMADILRAGAVGFSDDGSSVPSSSVMRSALEYAAMYDAPIIDHCEDHLASGGHIHEGEMSTRLGLAGIPSIAETITIARDIELAKFTGARIHIAHISTSRSVELVRRAKEEGVRITCEVTPHHLILTDEELVNYDTNLKVNPPLRTQADVEALRKALMDGTIDAIASDHAPHSIEEKDVEFDAAPFGMIGLETMLGLVITKIVGENVSSLTEMLSKMAVAPRKILNIPVPSIKAGEKANLTIFNFEEQWTVDRFAFRSQSRNSPFHGWTLNGKVTGVINNNKMWLARS
jgi:dihydroorotase